MTRLSEFDLDPLDVDADGIAQSQKPASAGNLTINGALASGGSYTAEAGVAHKISITAAADDSGRTFTVTGTDADGRAQTETITGPNTAAAESTKYWATVTQVAVDAATAGNITVGTVDELCTKTYPLNRHGDTGALVQFDVTGTINVGAQVTVKNIQQTFADQEAIPWVATSTTALTGATTDAIGNLEAGATACRFVIDSYSSGAEVQVYVSEEAD